MFLRRFLFPLTLLLGFVVFDACYYDNEEDLYGGDNNTTCDTTSVTYSLKVLPLLQSNCLGCHGDLSANALGGGYDLQGYDDLLPIAQDNLYCSINHGSGCSPMPKGNAKMATCNIAIIKKWIDDGAPNN
ncbi:MAG TPA: hypothetical protein PKH93_02940 [Chitinophagales bacterium]|jgi:hypothetical protein|nr:hypothetical protein [Chitinophagales bacterium]